tara:strand:+ start:37 stop:498 length:462 start_codon:yes stop_codon:yes gene_type:complete
MSKLSYNVNIHYYKGVITMSEKNKNNDVQAPEIAKVSREYFDSQMAKFDEQGKKFNLKPEVVQSMKEGFADTHAIKGTKLDSHLVRLGNVDKKYKKLITQMLDDVADVNLLFIVDGVRLSRKKRNSTIETEGVPQLKLVCEIVDEDKVSTPEA